MPGTPADPTKLADEIRRHVKGLDVIERLNAYGSALRFFEEEQTSARKGHTFLLELDVKEQSLSVRSYSNVAVAAEEYAAIERAIEGQQGKDAVLVTVESIETLRRAYPNYFLDTSIFVDTVREAIS